MIKLSPTFKIFLNLLNIKQVEYLLVGGFAVRYYGYQRQTRDLDIWAGTHTENADKLLEICREFGTGIPNLAIEPFQHRNRIIRIVFPPIRVEILNPIIGQKPEILGTFQSNQPEQIEILTVQTGVDFDVCFAERVEDVFDGVQVNIISLRHLKTIKQAGNRPKDLDDLKHLNSLEKKTDKV